MPSALAILLVILVSSPTAAVSAMSCHCFRDRSFDSARPDSADLYILATTQNSLLSAWFRVEKKGIVKAKMTGTQGEHLWVAYLAAQKTGMRAEDLLDYRNRSKTWPKALDAAGVSPRQLGPAMAAALARDGSDRAMASAVVDEVLGASLEARSSDVQELRSLGATDAAVIVAVFLSRVTGRGAAELGGAVQGGGTTWGTILDGAGFQPDQIETEVQRLVREGVRKRENGVGSEAGSR